jgi:hypothetical protein
MGNLAGERGRVPRGFMWDLWPSLGTGTTRYTLFLISGTTIDVYQRAFKALAEVGQWLSDTSGIHAQYHQSRCDHTAQKTSSYELGHQNALSFLC